MQSVYHGAMEISIEEIEKKNASTALVMELARAPMDSSDLHLSESLFAKNQNIMIFKNNFI